MKWFGYLFLTLSFLHMQSVAASDVTWGVKCLDGAGVTVRDNRLVRPDGSPLLDNFDAETSNVLVRRVFTRSDSDLHADRERIRARTGSPGPDLTQCFYVMIPENAENIMLERLMQLKEVDWIYRVSACMMLAATETDTPDFRMNQEYLFDSSGPHLARAWEYPWGRGTRVTVVDIESSCDRDHEELRHQLTDPTAVIGGTPSGVSSAVHHGTAVAGMLIANAANSIGIDGICHESDMKLYFVSNLSELPDAIDRSQAALNHGDILLIEMQVAGPMWPGGETQFGMVPAEWDAMTRLAVTVACGVGRIVIEPAGNGSQNLDDLMYADVFGPDAPDSGSIIVGAGRPDNRAPVSYTNTGSRVSVQGWAERMNPCCQVWTTGYGNAPESPQEVHQLYTDRFSGTSAAAAMIAGAVACVQSAGLFRSGRVLDPVDLREVLIQTGTAQSGGLPIGPLPDVEAAILAIPFIELDVDLRLNKLTFTGGDPFVLSHRTINPRESQAVVQYLVLQCIDTFFFQDPNGCFQPFVTGRPLQLTPGEFDETLIEFTWPNSDVGSADPSEGFAFYLGYTRCFGTGDPLIGNVDVVSFGWTSP
ncbi:S8 family serine peptidase [bacterium]|nr:S8 family serine peptidase [candidate division CSSED10-310 bacterium]